MLVVKLQLDHDSPHKNNSIGESDRGPGGGGTNNISDVMLVSQYRKSTLAIAWQFKDFMTLSMAQDTNQDHDYV